MLLNKLIPGIRIAGPIHDRSVRGMSIDEIQKALGATAEFDKACGQRANAPKTHV